MTRPGGALNQLFALPPDVMDGRTKDGFAYPVAIYHHNDGQAVTGDFAHHGRIAALRGKFIFRRHRPGSRLDDKNLNGVFAHVVDGMPLMRPASRQHRRGGSIR